jgi:superfamily II DNA or RNA helicase
MRSGDFGPFFYQATGSQPYPYQEKLATEKLATDEPVRSRLIHVPTGCGKTAAASDFCPTGGKGSEPRQAGESENV